MKLPSAVTGMLSVALLAFTVSSAVGQDSRRDRPDDRPDDRGRMERGGPGRGGPGRGGPGGGGPGGGGDPAFQLLQSEEVQTELQISPDQDEALKKLAEEGRAKRPEGVDFRSMSEEERREFFDSMRKEQQARMTEMKEKLEEVLLPQQMERLQQISLQARGVQALVDARITEALKITEDQKKSLEEVRDSLRNEMRDKMRTLFESGDRSNMQEAVTKIRKEVEEQLLAVLSSTQQQQFEDMKGKPFEMPQAMRGGGRGQFSGGQFSGGRGRGDRGRGGPDGGEGPDGRRGEGRPQRPSAEE